MRTSPELPHANAREPPELVTCKHMRRRLSPEGLDMRDDTPENRVFRAVLFAGLPVPALPFAQRLGRITDGNP